mgnify:CR=1 FL=1|tara:strand:+ start:208 stop:456 length:249 start_codon:yes stop_codon:yes gene_type:complete
MRNKKYNGWSNYATWRINLEILGDIEYEEEVDANYLKEIVEDVVFSNYNGTNNGLMWNYARAFVNNVDYYEIAAAINDGIAD